MSAAMQPEIDFDAINEHYTATVDLVGHDWRGEEDYRRFVQALIESRRGPSDHISQNDVRVQLLEETIHGPRCAIEHHRYSAFFNRACKEHLIAKARDEYGLVVRDICTTSPTGNNGKAQTLYRWTGT